MKYLAKLSILVIIGVLIVITSSTSFAAYEPTELDPETSATRETGFMISAMTMLGTQDPVDMTVMIINWLLTMLGVFFLALIVYAGIRWMLARGEEEEITKAKNIIKGALLGLIVILLSYGIAAFIFAYIVNISGR